MRRRTSGMLTVLLLISLSPFISRAKSTDTHAADTAAINKLFDDFNDAFNNHDAHAVASLFTDDGEFINVVAAATDGKDEIEQHLAPLFAGRLATAHRDVTLRGVRMLRADIATVDSDYEMSGVVGPDGAAVPPVKGLYDWIVVRQNGRWLIAVLHESNLPVAAPAR